MSCSPKSTLLCAAAAALALCASAASAEVLSFAVTRDSSLPQAQYDSGQFVYTAADVRTDGSIASAAIQTGTARAQAAYGVNRVAVDSNHLVDDEGLRNDSVGGPFATAISIWSDSFTVSGGNGSGTLSVSASVTGRFGPKSGDAYGASGAYYLLLATPQQAAQILAEPFAYLVHHEPCRAAGTVLCLEQSVPAPGHDDVGEQLPPGSPFGGELAGRFSFDYGQSFTLISILGGFANDYGVLNAFNSAHFGISAPAGAGIETASGIAYAAAAVPEPGSIGMLALGLAAGASAIRRRRSGMAA